jgi:hypothetical protein
VERRLACEADRGPPPLRFTRVATSSAHKIGAHNYRRLITTLTGRRWTLRHQGADRCRPRKRGSAPRGFRPDHFSPFILFPGLLGAVLARMPVPFFGFLYRRSAKRIPGLRARC